MRKTWENKASGPKKTPAPTTRKTGIIRFRIIFARDQSLRRFSNNGGKMVGSLQKVYCFDIICLLICHRELRRVCSSKTHYLLTSKWGICDFASRATAT